LGEPLLAPLAYQKGIRFGGGERKVVVQKKERSSSKDIKLCRIERGGKNQ